MSTTTLRTTIAIGTLTAAALTTGCASVGPHDVTPLQNTTPDDMTVVIPAINGFDQTLVSYNTKMENGNAGSSTVLSFGANGGTFVNQDTNGTFTVGAVDFSRAPNKVNLIAHATNVAFAQISWNPRKNFAAYFPDTAKAKINDAQDAAALENIMKTQSDLGILANIAEIKVRSIIQNPTTPGTVIDGAICSGLIRTLDVGGRFNGGAWRGFAMGQSATAQSTMAVSVHTSNMNADALVAGGIPLKGNSPIGEFGTTITSLSLSTPELNVVQLGNTQTYTKNGQTKMRIVDSTTQDDIMTLVRQASTMINLTAQRSRVTGCHNQNPFGVPGTEAFLQNIPAVRNYMQQSMADHPKGPSPR